MLEAPSISSIVAAIGVLIGVAITVLELRNLVKQRQTDLVTRLYSTFDSKELLEAWVKILTEEFRDYDKFVKKIGLEYGYEVGLFFEQLGVLLHRKLINIGLVDDLFTMPIKATWEKMKPIVYDYRKQFPTMGEHFEYLYNEMQKRGQRLQQIQ